jgi:hypothetical protein
MGGFFHGRFFGMSRNNLRRHATAEHLLHKDLWPTPNKTFCTTIAYKELFAVWWSCALWSHEWAGLTITVHVDNEGVRGMLLTGTCTSQNPSYMKLLRAIFWLAATGMFRLRPTRITSEANILADRLSRNGRRSEDFKAAFAEWQAAFADTPAFYPRSMSPLALATERMP